MMKEKTFGQRLRELRKANNLSQRDLADRVGLDFTYLSKIENDKMGPPAADNISKLAELLGADSDELLALAGKVPQGLGETLKKSEGARMFYRSTKDMDLSEADWQKLLQDLKSRKKSD